jgi:tRNA threonylcarbamoyladenosine biosynthesis protein TsaE
MNCEEDHNQVILSLPDLAVTERLGLWLGETAVAGDIILLSGGLGAGKTALTQFIGRGLQVPAATYITSPTFAIMHEYPGRLPLFHIDLYRLGGELEVEDLGLLDYLYDEGLCVIEWPDRLGGLQPDEFLKIEITYDIAMRRSVLLRFVGPSWQERRELFCRSSFFGY